MAELASKQRQIEQLYRDLVNVRAEALREGRRGVAALLAECARRQEATGSAPALISCDEIVRLLAPEGADKEGIGT